MFFKAARLIQGKIDDAMNASASNDPALHCLHRDTGLAETKPQPERGMPSSRQRGAGASREEAGESERWMAWMTW